MDKKKAVYMGVFILVIGVFTISFASAGFIDWFNKFTGRATSDTTSLNLTVGNTAPVITAVSVVPATDPSLNGKKNITINFTAEDDDGAGDLGNAQINLSTGTETSRFNSSCATDGGVFGNKQNYTCTVAMYYFDLNAAWTINATINDSANTLSSNGTTSFTYNLLTGMSMAPTSLSWGSLTVTSTNVGSSNDPVVINNTGNDVITVINVTAIDLAGETTVTDIIFASNFTVNTQDASDNTTMVNATSVQIDVANFTRGNHTIGGETGREELYFYLEAVNDDISSQAYSSADGGAWTVLIVT